MLVTVQVSFPRGGIAARSSDSAKQKNSYASALPIDRAELEIRIDPFSPDHSGLREPVMDSVNWTLTSARTF